MQSFIKKSLTYSSAFAALLTTGTAFADSKIRTRYTSGDHTNESTMYTHGERHRMETDASVLVQQPDLKRMIQINPRTKTYRLMSTGVAGAANDASHPQASAAGTVRKGGKVEIETTITDTGERKDFFGYQGRHLRMAIRQHSSPDACSPVNMRMETDGWYIDLDPNKNTGTADGGNATEAAGGCKDEIHSQVSGGGKPGFPVDTLMKQWENENSAPLVTRIEVLDLSMAPQDPSLFEIPAGYREAGNTTESVIAQTQPAKKTGVLRVAVLPVHDKANGKASLTPAANQQIAGMLTDGGVDAIPAESEAAATAAEADYLLYTDVTEVKGPGGAAQVVAKTGRFGGLVKNVARMTPVGSVAVAAATAVTALSGGVEAELCYKLVSTKGGEPVIATVRAGSSTGLNLRNTSSLISSGMQLSMMTNPSLNAWAMPGMMSTAMSAPGMGNSLAQGASPQTGENAALLAAFSKEAKAVVDSVKK